MNVAAQVAAWGNKWPRNVAGPFSSLKATTGGKSPIDFGVNGQLLRINTYLALGADLTADPSTWVWTDVTPYVLYESGVSTTTGKRDENSLVTAGISSLTFNNSDGRFSRKNRSGPYYGRLTRNTPILVTLNAGSSTYNAIEHYVNEWPNRWDKTQTFFKVPVKCGGILRRLSQGEDPLHSALYRSLINVNENDGGIGEFLGTHIVDYWPLEGGSDSDSGANAIAGGSSFVWTGTAPTPASSGGPAGTDGMWSFDTNTDAFANVREYDSSEQAWGLNMVFNMTAAPTLTYSLMPIVEVKCGGSLPKWRITFDKTNLDLIIEAFKGDETRVVADSFSLDTTFFGTSNVYNKNIMISLQAIDNLDGTVDYGASAYSPSAVINDDYYSVASGTVSGTLQNATSVRVPIGYGTRPNWLFGHFAIFDFGWFLLSAPFGAMTGYVGEHAGVRMQRLCAEEGVPFEFIGDPSTTTPAMGPQTAKKFLDLIREGEAADGGVLCEKNFGLAFQKLGNRYNAPYDLMLNVSAGHIADEIEAPDDDQRLRNYWEIKRPSGSSYIASDTDSIAAEGKHPDSKTVNVETDDGLRAVGEWELFKGINEDLRYPSIGLEFSREDAKELIDPWILMDFGARAKLLGVPAIVDSEQMADLVIEGKTEKFNQFTWHGTVNTSPGRIYNIMVQEGSGNQARVAPTQTLAADLNTTDTTLTAATAGSGPLMALKASFPTDFPYEIIIGDEAMRVTDVTGGSSPQTVTVERSINGVVQSHSTGDQLGLYRPAVIGR
jgi:hypothetical protein